jgi:hypothetical protein
MPDEHENILDGILKGVEEEGSHSVDWLILLNSVFTADGVKSPDTQLQEWAQENKLRYKLEKVNTRPGQTLTAVTFFR